MAKPDSAANNASGLVANPPPEPAAKADSDTAQQSKPEASKRPREIGGPSGLEPTRYGDWERNGRVSDF
jgi:hypothetical protein